MYCIECGAPIEATARICGTCRFPQPLEEFAEIEQHAAQATPPAAQKPGFPVRLEEPPKKRDHRPRLAAAMAVFIALCISTGLSVYLLTRQPAVHSGAASDANVSPTPEARSAAKSEAPASPAPPDDAASKKEGETRTGGQ
jgi:hypothetical protein